MFDSTFINCTKNIKDSYLAELNWFSDHKGAIVPHSFIKNRNFAKSPKGIYAPAGQETILGHGYRAQQRVVKAAGQVKWRRMMIDRSMITTN